MLDSSTKWHRVPFPHSPVSQTAGLLWAQPAPLCPLEVSSGISSPSELWERLIPFALSDALLCLAPSALLFDHFRLLAFPDSGCTPWRVLGKGCEDPVPGMSGQGLGWKRKGEAGGVLRGRGSPWKSEKFKNCVGSVGRAALVSASFLWAPECGQELGRSSRHETQVMFSLDAAWPSFLRAVAHLTTSKGQLCSQDRRERSG